MRQIRLRSGRLLGLNGDLHRCLFFHTTALCVCNQQIQTEGERGGDRDIPLAAAMPQTVAMVILQILYQVEEFYSAHCEGGAGRGE